MLPTCKCGCKRWNKRTGEALFDCAECGRAKPTGKDIIRNEIAEHERQIEKLKLQLEGD